MFMNSPDYLRLVVPQKRRKAFWRDRLIKFATRTRAISPLLRLLQASSLTPADMNPRFSAHPEIHSARQVLIYAHYDSEGIVSRPDRHMLAEFRKLGYAVLVVSTAVDTDSQHEELWTSIRTEIDGLITRPNIGFDFGSWAAGIGVLDLQNRPIDRLLLLNNSVYGPMRELSETINRASATGDVFGLIASTEFTRHIPSVFLGFHPHVVASPAFQGFWSTFPVGRWKNVTILRAEMIWEKFFTRAGFTTGSLYQSTKHLYRNPYTFIHRELIIHGFPFLKKSLFLRNYDDLDMSTWAVGLGINSELVDIIATDVRRIRKQAGLD
jgi:lipopolysaccharide biosynthesis protein